MSDALTVITTVYNGEHFLPDYAENLTRTLRQQDRAILVDDGSVHPVSPPENLIRDNRFKLIPANRIGRGAALNLAIENAQTDLIALQDIDDCSLSNRLEIQSVFLATHPDALVFTNARSDPRRLGRSGPRRIPPSRLYFGNPLHHSSLAFRRPVWEQAGGYATDLPCCIDLDFYLRASCKAGAPLWQLGIPLIVRNLDPSGRYFATISSETYQSTLQTVLDHYRDSLPLSHWMILAMMRQQLERLKGSRV
jgi:glycosyltransferase involved in cell wall biosynthesis